ncbi:conserved hypothetical protein [Wolbachia endosymbiont of Drosophila simulans]|nr:conserved hypothetical protein [Wolbachia endosymbiont of Drosophila simulans]
MSAFTFIPSINPFPLTSSIIGNLLAKSSSLFFKYLPLISTFFKKPGLSNSSSTALPTEVASGLPPKVEPCIPTAIYLAAFSVARQAPSGNPPPIPFARAHISGSTPICSYANNFPVLPAPHCTQSKNNNMSFSSHSLLSSFIKTSFITLIPPCPCIGSINITPIPLEIAFFTLSILGSMLSHQSM